MPHFQIDYSGNLETVVDIGDLCEHIRAQAAMIDAFPLAGIRVRAIRVDHYAMADGNDKHGFVDISVRMRGGRTPSVKQDAMQKLFEAARTYLGEAMQTNSIALSLEMRDIDPDLSLKTGTTRGHLET